MNKLIITILFLWAGATSRAQISINLKGTHCNINSNHDSIQYDIRNISNNGYWFNVTGFNDWKLINREGETVVTNNLVDLMEICSSNNLKLKKGFALLPPNSLLSLKCETSLYLKYDLDYHKNYFLSVKYSNEKKMIFRKTFIGNLYIATVEIQNCKDH
jgi:hypothetical protein